MLTATHWEALAQRAEIGHLPSASRETRRIEQTCREADDLIHQCIRQLERNTCLNRDPLATQCLAAVTEATTYRLHQVRSRYPCCLTGTYTHEPLYQYEFYNKHGVSMQSYLVLPGMSYFIEAVMLLCNYTTVLRHDYGFEQVRGAHQYIQRVVAALSPGLAPLPRPRKRNHVVKVEVPGVKRVKLEPPSASSTRHG